MFERLIHALTYAGLIALAGTSCSPQHTATPTPQRITVLTWNLYHGEHHYAPGTSNLDAIARIINEYQPDIVAFQEVDQLTLRTAGFNHGKRKDLMQELAAKTGMHGYFAQAMEYDGGGYGEGILSRQAATPVITALPSPRGGEPRVLVSVDYTLLDGRTFTFAGTHLCHEFEDNRIAQIAAISGVVKASERPVLVAGDFNFNPGEAPYLAFTGSMEDSALVHGTPTLTWPYHAPEERLDYIFADKRSHWQIKDVRLIDSDASDHFPLLAVFELPVVLPQCAAPMPA